MQPFDRIAMASVSSLSGFYALNVRTTLVTYCRQIGHSANFFPHSIQVAMCPHSNSTQSRGASIHILQQSTVLPSKSVIDV